MLLRIHPENPQPRHIQTVVECLIGGGVVIYPTDTVYGLGCDIFQQKAIERIASIKQVDPKKAQLSFVCNDLSDLSVYVKSISNPVYRLLRQYLPGPYTFILSASKQVPKMLKSKKDTIGLRVPDHHITKAMVAQLQHPILSASLPDDHAEEMADPDMIYEKFKHQVDIVIDGGPGGIVPSTIVDCTGDVPVLLRQGLGEWNE